MKQSFMSRLAAMLLSAIPARFQPGTKEFDQAMAYGKHRIQTAADKIENRRKRRTLHPKQIDRGFYHNRPIFNVDWNWYEAIKAPGKRDAKGVLYRAAPAGYRWQNNKLVAR